MSLTVLFYHYQLIDNHFFPTSPPPIFFWSKFHMYHFINKYFSIFLYKWSPFKNIYNHNIFLLKNWFLNMIKYAVNIQISNHVADSANCEYFGVPITRDLSATVLDGSASPLYWWVCPSSSHTESGDSSSFSLVRPVSSSKDLHRQILRWPCTGSIAHDLYQVHRKHTCMFAVKIWAF